MKRRTKERFEFAGIATAAVIIWSLITIVSIAVPVVIVVWVLKAMDVL
jgi:hypothetical protein